MFLPRPRTLLFFALIASVLFWLRFGEEILSTAARNDSAAELLTQYQYEVARKRPEAVNWVQSQKDHFGERTLAAGIAAEQGRLGDFDTRQRLLLNAARLVRLYEDDSHHDDGLLWSYGAALEVADDAYLGEELLERLERAQADPELWPLVRDNPIALSSDLLFDAPKYRDYYATHQSWVDAMLIALTACVDEAHDEMTAEAAAPPAIRLDTVLEAARRSDPHLRLAVPEPQAAPEQAAVVFLMFLEHGDVLNRVAAADVPVLEAVEVLLLGGDAVFAAATAAVEPPDEADLAAAKLIRIYREKPAVWQQARREPLLLQFDAMVPAYSGRLLERFPDHGIPSLIVTQYAETPVAAAAAIDRYGELAVAVLAHYADSDRFVELLSRGDDGYRSVMVAAMAGDEGLEKLAGDPRYLSKLLDDEGNPRRADWWQSVPLVGGIGNVARNYALDRPSDWSEIGWATWDVADATLIVFTLGTSKLMSEAGKQGLKATARTAGRNAAAAAPARTAARAGGRSAPAALARLGTLAGRTSAGEAAAVGARVSAGSGMIRLGSRVVLLGGRPVAAISGKAYHAGRVTLAAARGTPPLVRLWVARGILGASLLARTPAMIRSVGNGVVTMTGQIVDELGRQVDAIKELVKLPIAGDGKFAHWLHRVAYFGILVLLCGLAYLAFGRDRRSVWRRPAVMRYT